MTSVQNAMGSGQISELATGTGRPVTGPAPRPQQGEAYANKLREAGVPVTSVRFNGMMHDFMLLNALRDTESTRAAVGLAITALRRAFDSVSVA